MEGRAITDPRETAFIRVGPRRGARPSGPSEGSPASSVDEGAPDAPALGGSTRRARLRPAVATALAILALVGLVAGTLISVYAAGDFIAPAGFDTPKYVWRANLVAGEGLDALPGSSTPPFREHPDRPGYPVLAAMVRSVTGIEPFDLTFVLPALMGTLVGLAAAAFAVRILGEPRWSIPVYGLIVGASLHVVVTAAGLIDNLVLDAVVMALAVSALLAASGHGYTAALILVAAGVMIHWPLTAVFVALLALLAIVLAPASLKGRREGRSLSATPSGRLAMVIAGSMAILGAGIGSFGSGVQSPEIHPTVWTDKLSRFVARLRFWLLGPAAAAGAGALAAIPGDDGRRRHGLVLLLLWGGAGGVAIPLLLLGLSVPAHRLVLFGLAVPVLAAAGVVGLARTIHRFPVRAVGGVGAAMVVGAALGGTVLLARQAWDERARENFPPERLAEATAAGRYLEAIGNRGPVVFVIDRPPGARRVDQPSALAFGVIRSALPSDQIRLAHTYLGDPDNLLAGRPTLRPGHRAYNVTSLDLWDGVRPLLSRRPVVLVLSSFNPPRQQAEPSSVGQTVAPGVQVLRGPPPPALLPAPDPPTPPSPTVLAGRFGVVLALLAAVGIGWAVALLPGGWLLRVSLAPTFGLAVLVIAGSTLGRAGLDGPAARPWIAAAVTVVGWATVAARRRRASARRGALDPTPR